MTLFLLILFMSSPSSGTLASTHPTLYLGQEACMKAKGLLDKGLEDAGVPRERRYTICVNSLFEPNDKGI